MTELYPISRIKCAKCEHLLQGRFIPGSQDHEYGCDINAECVPKSTYTTTAAGEPLWQTYECPECHTRKTKAKWHSKKCPGCKKAEMVKAVGVKKRGKNKKPKGGLIMGPYKNS